MNDMRIPFGLCDITFDGQTYSNLADEAVFEAIPSYKKIRYGQMQSKYLLEDYLVSLDITLSEENYGILKLSNPSLADYNGGLYDNPSNVNHIGKTLIIHPTEAGSSKEYDITIFSAIVDPEKEFSRTYKKEIDGIVIRFLGQPAKKIDNNYFKSYFFIGDTERAGVN